MSALSLIWKYFIYIFWLSTTEVQYFFLYFYCHFVVNCHIQKQFQIIWQLKVSEPKWVNHISDTIGVNSLRLEGLQLLYDVNKKQNKNISQLKTQWLLFNICSMFKKWFLSFTKNVKTILVKILSLVVYNWKLIS